MVATRLLRSPRRGFGRFGFALILLAFLGRGECEGCEGPWSPRRGFGRFGFALILLAFLGRGECEGCEGPWKRSISTC